MKDSHRTTVAFIAMAVFMDKKRIVEILAQLGVS
jgi:hypothetical protein